MKTKMKLRGPGLVIELDAEQIFPDDPGQGTPALVVLPSGDTATFNCASSEGECDGTQLTPAQCAWLNQQEDAVDSFITAHTRRIRGVQ